MDGLFLPTYTVSGDAGGGGIALGGGGAINPTAGRSIAATEHTDRGLLGLTLRPNAYVWRLRGERPVLAPLNGTRLGYPIDDKRNFGYSGLSVASERWDVRYAVVIEGALRVPSQNVKTVTIYLDYQTQQPLFWITRGSKRRMVEIGILVHRYTGDIADMPEWPDGGLALVFEPVSAVFYNALAGRGGWRRESYRIDSLPFSKAERRVMTSSDPIGRGK